MENEDEQLRLEYEVDRQLYELLEHKEFVPEFQIFFQKTTLIEHGGLYD
jgi:hypothetical protein